MALSYNLSYQEIISVHPTRRQTQHSGTSENESYRAQKLLSIIHVNYTYTTLQYIVPNKY